MVGLLEVGVLEVLFLEALKRRAACAHACSLVQRCARPGGSPTVLTRGTGRPQGGLASDASAALVALERLLKEPLQ